MALYCGNCIVAIVAIVSVVVKNNIKISERYKGLRFKSKIKENIENKRKQR